MNLFVLALFILADILPSNCPEIDEESIYVFVCDMHQGLKNSK